MVYGQDRSSRLKGRGFKLRIAENTILNLTFIWNEPLFVFNGQKKSLTDVCTVKIQMGLSKYGSFKIQLIASFASYL